MNPKYESGFSFHSKLATVQKNGKWGAINSKGRWKVKPRYDLMSTVINGEYLAEKDSVFYWKTVDGEIKYSGEHFKVNLLILREYAKKSKVEDKELIVRVLQIITATPYTCHPTAKMILENERLVSHLLIRYYYFTRLFIEGKLN